MQLLFKNLISITPMATIGIKRPYEGDDNSEFTSNKKFKGEHLGLSMFELPELVENIIKYLLKNTETIVSISMVSKRYKRLRGISGIIFNLLFIQFQA